MCILSSAHSKGHKKRDPKCPKNNQTKKVAAQLHAARDIIQEDDEEDDQEVIQPVEEDRDGNSEEEEEDPYYGSQYTSEGEEVKINDLEHQEWSDQETDVLVCFVFLFLISGSFLRISCSGFLRSLIGFFALRSITRHGCQQCYLF
jgi:hypothetical protein